MKERRGGGESKERGDIEGRKGECGGKGEGKGRKGKGR